MDNIHIVNDSNSNGDRGESSYKIESKETVITFGEDSLNYSDFENIEYEEVSPEVINIRPDDEYSTSNSLKSSTRKRTRNFTQTECSMLCTLMEEYSDILELKKTDHKTNTLKNNAWAEITDKFNSTTTEEYRTPMQLKKFYENLKKKRKKEGIYKIVENGDAHLSCSSDKSQNDNHRLQSENQDLPKMRSRIADSFQGPNSFLKDYQRKKLELLEREIEKVRSACDQQRRLFLLQEEKLLLEIEEIKERMKKK